MSSYFSGNFYSRIRIFGQGFAEMRILFLLNFGSSDEDKYRILNAPDELWRKLKWVQNMALALDLASLSFLLHASDAPVTIKHFFLL